MSEKRVIRTTLKQIASSLPERLNKRGLTDDNLNIWYNEAESRCWCCRNKHQLERAHVIPHVLGGSDEPENYMILCKECHAEAPNSINPNHMWDWLLGHKFEGMAGETRAQLLGLKYVFSKIKTLSEEDFEIINKRHNGDISGGIRNLMKNSYNSHGAKYNFQTYKCLYDELLDTTPLFCNQIKFIVK